jgi:hypothetical protein
MYVFLSLIMYALLIYIAFEDPQPTSRPTSHQLNKKNKKHKKKIAPKNASPADASITPSTANRDKWVDVDSPLIPPVVDAWARAIRETVKDPTRIRADVPHLQRGYAYPDPNSLAGLSLDQQAKKLCAWLGLRPAVYSKSFVDAGQRPPTANGAAWRCVLTLDSSTILPIEPFFATPEAKETKASKLRTAVKELFGDQLAARLRGPPGVVYWHDTQLQCQDDKIVDLDPDIIKQIIWELFEHNFRFELCSLDLAAAPSEYVDHTSAVARQDAVRNIWEGCKLIIWDDPFPRYDANFQGETINNRMGSLEKLQSLMKSWPDVPSAIADGSFYGVTDNETQERLEYDIVLFYCQSFYDFFGRPPILPHRIPQLLNRAG